MIEDFHIHTNWNKILIEITSNKEPKGLLKIKGLKINPSKRREWSYKNKTGYAYHRP